MTRADKHVKDVNGQADKMAGSQDSRITQSLARQPRSDAGEATDERTMNVFFLQCLESVRPSDHQHISCSRHSFDSLLLPCYCLVITLWLSLSLRNAKCELMRINANYAMDTEY